MKIEVWQISIIIPAKISHSKHLSKNHKIHSTNQENWEQKDLKKVDTYLSIKKSDKLHICTHQSPSITIIFLSLRY